MVFECANAFFFWSLNEIGGVESHFYYMAKKYGAYDVTFFYRSGNFKQIKRLRKYARCYQIGENDLIKCNKFFFSYNTKIISKCIADEYNFVIHANYLDQIERGQIDKNNLPIDDRIDHYYAVSQSACDSWKKLTGLDCSCLYQPIKLDDVDFPLMFVSATRLTKEKGWHRMLKLAEELDRQGVNYLWYIFTNSGNKEPAKNMIFQPSRLDITDKLQCFDAFIQLSDNEGYCFSVVEALLRGVPAIVTDLPVFDELGLNGNNSIKLPLDMGNIPVEKIKNIRKMRGAFKYEAKHDGWGDVLIHEPSKRHENKYIVQATDYWRRKNMIAVDLGGVPEPNEEWEVTEERLNILLEYEQENHIKLINWRYKNGGETEKTDRPETV